MHDGRCGDGRAAAEARQVLSESQGQGSDLKDQGSAVSWIKTTLGIRRRSHRVRKQLGSGPKMLFSLFGVSGPSFVQSSCREVGPKADIFLQPAAHLACLAARTAQLFVLTDQALSTLPSLTAEGRISLRPCWADLKGST